MWTRLKKKLLWSLAALSRSHKLYRCDFLWRRLLNPDKKNNLHFNTILLIKNLLWQINTASYLEWTLFFYGTYEEYIQKLLSLYLKPGDLAVDVGSNIGIHTLHMATLVGSSGTVVSFEPHPDIYARQMKNLELNQITNVVALKLGLSNTTGTVQLTTFDDQSSSNQGTSKVSLGAIAGKSIAIKVMQFDEVIEQSFSSSSQRIKLIKVDIEGHEEAFFMGAKKTISQHLPIIIFEDAEASLHNDNSAMHQILRENNYRIFGINFNTLTALSFEHKPQHAFYRILALPTIEMKKEI